VVNHQQFDGVKDYALKSIHLAYPPVNLTENKVQPFVTKACQRYSKNDALTFTTSFTGKMTA
jgi:hypothetical protein